MLNTIKFDVMKIIQKAAAAFGYKFVKNEYRNGIDFEEFKILITAYNRLFNDKYGGDLIDLDETRLKLFMRLQGTPIPEAYFLLDALAKTKTVEGDVCEFGVAQGETSALIANEIRDLDKKLHLFDTFEGLPKPTEKDKLKDDIFSLGNIEAYAGTMSCPEDLVIARLKAIAFPANRYVIHKGFIEKLVNIDKGLPQNVSFAYVDFDFYEPIKIALDYLHNVTLPNAMIMVDDYDFFSTGAQTAVDEFLADQNQAKENYQLTIPDHQFGYFAILTKR